MCAAALAVPTRGSAQATGGVTGTVVDLLTGQPIASAQVTVVGTSAGTLTGPEGRFLLRGLPVGVTRLRAQRIGFTPQEITVTLNAGAVVTANFSLPAAAALLSEVVVTGYGTSTRANISSAVASVRIADIENTPVAGVDAAIQGRATGVQVIQNAGNPGNGITVRIRGAASISASNQPLYVIDGVPLLRDDYTQLGVGGQDLTGVTGINPDEIESINILKDAAAAAIYGSRGSNGVVMITTRRGRAGQNRVQFSMYAGSQSVPKGNRWQLVNAREYLEYMNEAASNDGYGANYFANLDTVTVDTDWQSEVFRTTPVMNYTLGVTGGTDRVRYFVAGSHFDQEGVVLGSAYNRQNGRVNVDLIASARLTLKSSLSITREDHDRISGDNTIHGVVTNAIAVQPWVPVRKPDGSFTGTDDGLEYTHPVAIAEYDFTEARILRSIAGLEAAYTLASGLTLTGRAGLDILNLRDLDWSSPKVLGSYAEGAKGVSVIGNNNVNRYVLESYLNFDPKLGSSASLSLTGGASLEWNGQELDRITGEGFAHDEFQYAGNAATATDYAGNWTGHNLVSFFSRAQASLHDRYFLMGSVRADGSSRFGARNRYGVFPAASIGWQLTNEPFLGFLTRFGELKLRASYGFTGNHDIADNFAPIPRFGRANYADVAGLGQINFGNPDLRWESTREYDVGLDLSLFDGRVTVLGDWYQKVTEDLLLSRPITSTSGQTTVLENVGNMENRGFELGLNTVNFQSQSGRGFKWFTDFNISWNKNKVTKLFRDEPFPVGLYSTSRVEVGHPLSAFYTLRFDSVNSQTGDAVFFDKNGDGNINADDRVFIGSPHPDYWGGLTNQMSWGGFDLRTFFQFAQGHMIFNAIGVFADDGGYYNDNKFKRVLKRWQKPGDVTTEPRASWDGTSGLAGQISSKYFEDGSYIRLHEVTLGYRLPARVAGFLGLQETRVYVSGRNLKTWTDYSGYSPDVNSNGSGSNTALSTEFYAYPLARTFMFGISGAW
ncbi:MAG: TonB-dependent receptor [Gemmatimonadetes bacterium]|nr:TonB-dependent receptor [Gemmatimonadota bacterium]